MTWQSRDLLADTTKEQPKPPPEAVKDSNVKAEVPKGNEDNKETTTKKETEPIQEGEQSKPTQDSKDKQDDKDTKATKPDGSTKSDTKHSKDSSKGHKGQNGNTTKSSTTTVRPYRGPPTIHPRHKVVPGTHNQTCLQAGESTLQPIDEYVVC